MTDDPTFDELLAAVTALRGELALANDRIALLERGGEAAAPAVVATEQQASRRGFLRLAGATAAGVAAAGVAGLTTATPAAADTGDAVKAGKDVGPSATTDVTSISSINLVELHSDVFLARNQTRGAIATPTGFGIAVAGLTSGKDLNGLKKVGVYGKVAPGDQGTADGIGVLGSSDVGDEDLPTLSAGVGGFSTDGHGVYGQSTNYIGVLGTSSHNVAVYGDASGFDGVQGHSTDQSGVSGFSTNGYGVFGTSPGAEGVHGESGSHPGVVGKSTTDVGVKGTSTSGDGGRFASTDGIALVLSGSARMLQQLQANGGAPTSGAHTAGEQLRDATGALYLCVADGTPGTWRKVVAQHPDFAAAGGSLNLLAHPFRLFDTRGKGVLKAGTDTTLQVTGITVDGLSVPAGATGLIGNITGVNEAGGGFFSIFPANTSFAGTSNLNYVAGIPVANGFTCALSPTGAVKIRCGAADADCIIDVAGFLF